MKELKIKTFLDLSIGKSFIINPDENNMSRKRDDALLNTEILYKNDLYKIIEIESHAVAGNYIRDIALLTKLLK